MILTAEELKRERSNWYGGGGLTHAPVLASVLAIARPGPVLEVGVGYGSSPLLSEMCKVMGRMLFGVDNDDDWLRMVEDLAYGQLGTGWAPDGTWAVVFVDHSPIGERPSRAPVVRALRGKTEWLVGHDVLSEDPDYDAALSEFKYRHDYTTMTPYTSVCSDERPYPGAR